MNHTDAMIDVAAVQQADILVSNKYILITNGADTITQGAGVNLGLPVSINFHLPLRWKEVSSHAHRLWLAWVERILKLRQTYRLYILNFILIVFGMLKHKDNELLAFKVQTTFIFRVN